MEEVLRLPHDATGSLVSRPNRFLAIVDVDGLGEQEVHVHDPGRLKELLFPGNELLLRRAEGKKRKTKWDLIAARYEEQWVLVHSGYHRAISEWVLNSDISPFGHVEEIRPEVRIGHSRLDFVLTDRGEIIGVEVKGCSLAIDDIALFPDAPTERGRKHLETLMEMKREGVRAALMVLVFRKDAGCFYPKEDTDPKFANTFWDAMEAGVEVYPLVFTYENGKIWYLHKIPVCGSI
ncbi:MAG: DNA/RNA nuclease SfsA [Thermoplasmata archaeon]|nr:DNA/RNA nuclease SfsA [Thermoplasmata archaeon]